MKALKELSELDYMDKLKKYPNMPVHAISRARFNDHTANQLTGCILKWLTLHGHWGTRITTTGRQIQGSTVTDVIGRAHIMAGKWIPGTTRKGTADIHGIINGRHVSIEVKVGRDKMSEHQNKTKKAIEQSGGIYWVVKTFDEFMIRYKELMGKS